MNFTATYKVDGKPFDINIDLTQEQIEFAARQWLAYKCPRLAVDKDSPDGAAQEALLDHLNGVSRTRSTMSAEDEARIAKNIARYDAGEAKLVQKYGTDAEKAHKRIRQDTITKIKAEKADL